MHEKSCMYRPPVTHPARRVTTLIYFRYLYTFETIIITRITCNLRSCSMIWQCGEEITKTRFCRWLLFGARRTKFVLAKEWDCASCVTEHGDSIKGNFLRYLCRSTIVSSVPNYAAVGRGNYCGSLVIEYHLLIQLI